MKIAEFQTGIEKLQNMYNVKFSKEKLKSYYEVLKDMDFGEYMKQIDIQSRTNKFLPNPAQILNKQGNNVQGEYSRRDYTRADLTNLYAN
jgi:hypothetical protein